MQDMQSMIRSGDQLTYRPIPFALIARQSPAKIGSESQYRVISISYPSSVSIVVMGSLGFF
jgi:hypothetical protein